MAQTEHIIALSMIAFKCNICTANSFGYVNKNILARISQIRRHLGEWEGPFLLGIAE